jgi:hypothetical protein
MIALHDHAHGIWLMHVTVQVLKELENLSAEAMMVQQHSVYGTEWLMLQLAFAGSLLMDLLQMRWQSHAPAGEHIFLARFHCNMTQQALWTGFLLLLVSSNLIQLQYWPC